ncbi:hypothetical protein MMC09_001881 [Bachmanniomyces sp. S44760]|nr:hypothetical protein [Bachmanniomyces sp. S44760]
MSNEQNQQQGQYPPPQWATQSGRGPYPPPPAEGGSYGGPPGQHPYQQPSEARPGEMVTLPPPQAQQHPDLYRHPTYDMYPQHPHHAPYPPHPQDPHRDQPGPHMFNQPAPRQRTAIACRYCRRRKIRCHGFDSSPDGRCTNCIRFHQECIFTPVSSQAQAFVPAHTAYPHLRNTGRMQAGGRPIYSQDGQQPVIYSAHGQPLGQIPHQGQDPNYSHPPPGYPSNPYPGPGYDERGHPPPQPQEQVSRKRPRVEGSPHTGSNPPPEASSSHPYPQQQRHPSGSGRRSSGGTSGAYEYPDPTQLIPVSPASSQTSYQSASYQQQPPQQPYYPPQQPAGRRTSPQSSYSYDARASGSPQGSTSSTSGYTYPGGLHPPQTLPPTRESGLTPPPGGREGSGGSNGSRAGMSVRDMLGPGDGSGGRTSTDSDMLKALNRRGM